MDFWNLPYIFINDENPSSNWLITAATYDWCSGSGTVNEPYIIENVTITRSGAGPCIQISNSEVHFIIRNCTLTNAHYGIYLLRTSNGQIINNTCTDHFYAIYMFGSDEACNYNNIIENKIFNNEQFGITLYAEREPCIYNNIWNNTITNNGDTAIYLYTLYASSAINYNSIKDNTINNNDGNGIGLSLVRGSCDSNEIIGNNVSNNGYNGIYLRGRSPDTYCEYNDINGNILYNNTQNGILLDYSNNNEIMSNTFKNNTLYGVILDTEANYNRVYNNSFIGNTVNALDSGTSNQWDINSLGNYWDDYSGVDANDNGIGDTPYDVPPAGGSVDNFPIWDDGDDLPPNITIISPVQNQVCGYSAPEYNITIEDLSPINTTWYTMDGGLTNFTFSGLTGFINQTAWDNKGTEIMTLRFYANDSLGHIGFKDVLIWKDLVAPKITINSPTPNQLCGITAPTFDLQIIEPNLQEKRYSLNGRPNITFTTETQFSQTEWNQVGNGTVSITFYAIDKVGNMNSSEVIVRKDAYVPDIIIYSPLDTQKFGKTAPDYNISIIEEDLASTWYTIEGIAGTFPFTGLIGTINQDAWDDAPKGEITITFYAIDNAGNIGSESVVVIKSIPSEPAILGYNLFLLLGILSVVSILISKKVKKS